MHDNFAHPKYRYSPVSGLTNSKLINPPTFCHFWFLFKPFGIPVQLPKTSNQTKLINDIKDKLRDNQWGNTQWVIDAPQSPLSLQNSSPKTPNLSLRIPRCGPQYLYGYFLESPNQNVKFVAKFWPDTLLEVLWCKFKTIDNESMKIVF